MEVTWLHNTHLYRSRSRFGDALLLRNIIDDALPHANMQLLVTLVIAMVLVTIVSAVINMIQTIISTKIGQSVLHDLRVKLYSHLHSLSLSFFTDTRGGEIQSRITQDIGSLQELVSNTAHESAKNLSVVIMTVIAMFLWIGNFRCFH